MSDANVYQPTPLFLKTQRKRFTNSTRDRSVTMMLLAIVALFLLCNGLAFCNSIVESVMLLRDSDGESSDDEWERQIVKWFESSVSAYICVMVFREIGLQTCTFTLLPPDCHLLRGRLGIIRRGLTSQLMRIEGSSRAGQ